MRGSGQHDGSSTKQLDGSSTKQLDGCSTKQLDGCSTKQVVNNIIKIQSLASMSNDVLLADKLVVRAPSIVLWVSMI